MSDKFDRLMSKPHLTGPKRQHFVPESYLEHGFAKDGILFVLDRKNGAVDGRTPNNTAVIGHYYTFEDNQGRKRFDLEALFAYIESETAPIIKGLIAGESLKFEVADMLATYMALLASRTPAAMAEASFIEAKVKKIEYRARLGDKELALRYVEDWQRNSVDADTTLNHEQRRKLAADISRMVREDAYRIEVSPERARQIALQHHHVIAHEMYKRDWVIVTPEHGDDQFITSDSPVVLTTLSSSARGLPLGYGSSHGQILFPLSTSCALILSGDQQRFGRATVSRVNMRRFNTTIAENSHQYCYAASEDVLRSIEADLQFSKREWRPRVDVGSVERDGRTFAFIHGGVR